jgi:demethylmenaquinone methyltransferase/2-methoxy-6-polyprenyl-1,4-benzoquinol methylase
MFTAIAPRYDVLNHTLSLNIDRRWRRLAVDRLGWESAPGGTYLDLCAGTCDIAAELERRRGFEGTLIGADFVIDMLEIGRRKTSGVRPVAADALRLPFPARHFDGCTVGFGVRNLTSIGAGLGEVARVLKPGRRLVILEFSMPQAWPLRPLYLFYFRHLLPLIGRTVSQHTTAYSYLPNSVEQFPEGDAFKECLGDSGFEDVRQQKLSGGIASLYWGVATGAQTPDAASGVEGAMCA